MLCSYCEHRLRIGCGKMKFRYATAGSGYWRKVPDERCRKKYRDNQLSRDTLEEEAVKDSED